MGLFDEIKGEIEAFSCFKKQNWPKSDAREGGVPWRSNENEGLLDDRAIGLRQHAFKNIWEQSLDPQGTNKSKDKSTKPETWSIDWKKWPPKVPVFPKGIKIPVMLVPQIDLRLSLSGRWDEITNGTTVVPINYGSKKFFENLGGHLNMAKSVSCKVTPPSLLFLHTKAGQFYSVKLKVHNSGNNPRRVRILPPANPCFTVVRHAQPEDAISPGCNLTLTVQYRPKTNDSLNDVVVFHVDRDGTIVVPLISSCVPEPILEVEEWNCGCCVVGVPRTAHFEVKNVGGEGRFWIISEKEFNNEYLECYLKFKKDLIKESTREIVKQHTDAMDGNDVSEKVSKKVVGRGEASGFIQRQKDSIDEDDFFTNFNKNRGKLQPRIYTKNFRIQPTCFRLQRSQRISIKVRYLPKDANFHYEKLCIMCENGEVRWIAVKGLGIERDSDKLIEVKALCTAPPVDLPSDPRTKYIMDCGDLIPGEVAKLSFSIVNRSCIPLYFFWSIRPLLTDPEASPDKTDFRTMERFYESTIFNVEVPNLNFTGGLTDTMQEEEENLQSWTTKVPLTVSPAQGLLEKKQEMHMSFSAECPMSFGYHACVISLFVEQVDEESKNAVLKALKGLDRDQLSRPISHASLHKELPHDDTSSVLTNKSKDGKVIYARGDEATNPFRYTPASPPKETGKTQTSENISRISASEPIDLDNFEEEREFIPLKDTIKGIRESFGKEVAIDSSGLKGENANITAEKILPLAVATRSSGQLRENEGKAIENRTIPQKAEKGRNSKEEPRKSNGNADGKQKGAKRDSFNFHVLDAASVAENDRAMSQGLNVYEDLKHYTDNVVPQYKLWPNREKTLTPVAEVEIWLHSVPLNVQFSPPFILVNGLVKTSIERFIKVKNGTGHNVEMNFENICDEATGAITCHPKRFSVKPNDISTFKVVIYFERHGEMHKQLRGTITLPFMTMPCFLSTYMRAYGPFLEVLTPTLNFGIVPLSSETMKTLALKNGGDRPLKWVARIAPEGMEDENEREISGHQTRIHDKRLVRIWPEWGVLEPKETAGMQVYFCAELTGEIASYVEVMVEGNPQSVVSVPVYGEIELPCLVLEKGLIRFSADDFVQQPVQNGICTIINPTGFNVPFAWQCPVGWQGKLCGIYIQPKKGIVPAKSRIDFAVSIESYGRDEPLELDNLFVPCCVEGMREPLILKIITN